MEAQNAIRSVVENITTICQLKPEQEECLVHILKGGPTPDRFLEKFNLSTVTDRQQETGEAKVRQGDNCDCVTLGFPHGQSGYGGSKTRSMCCTAWLAQWSRNHGGEFQPYFWYPNPGLSIQKDELC